MKLLSFFFFLSSFFFLSTCAPADQLPSQTVSVYATSSSQPWLTEVYSCADDLSIIIKIETDEPEIYLRLGEPDRIVSPVYKIGEEEILVAVNHAGSTQNLSLNEARELFAGGSPSAQVWVFSSGEDIQRAFDELSLRGIRVSASARVASSLEQMSAALSSESNAVGILPKSALMENMRGVYSAGVVPVLAVTKQEPQGAVSALIACLQK